MSEYSFGRTSHGQPSSATKVSLNNNTYFSKYNSFSSVNNQPRSSYNNGKRMARSSLFVMVKYSIFVNWTLTGFWIIYNSSDYSLNAQIISEKLSSARPDVAADPDRLRVEKASVVYGLIAYTMFTSFVSFFGLVGVCYENFYLTCGLAICYVIYTFIDATFHIVMGVKFGYFLTIMYILLIINAGALFYLCYLIKYANNAGHRRDYVASSDRDLSAI